MLRSSVAAAIAFAVLAAVPPAEARSRRILAPVCDNVDVMQPCAWPPPALWQAAQRPRRSLKQAARYVGRSERRAAVRASWSGGLVAPLAAKVAEIQAACGSRLVSGVRHTLIAGTRRISLHASGRAADIAGNPGCIYAQLQGWPGGYSTDYGRVQHVHVSYDAQGGREMGVRFAHGGGRRHGRRHYHRHTRLARR